MLVVYHGINDVRMNCCPESSYRPDYTHCGWYDSFERRLSAGRISLPELVFEKRIPLAAPDAKHLAFGNTIKTIDAFRSNLEAILASAESENQSVLLPTFAYHIPASYTREKFRKGELDYGPGQQAVPAEIWGLPHNVTRTIDAHNQVIRELARKHGCVILVDLARELPTNGRHFSDPCHLTDFGRQAFVERILPPLMRRLSVRVAPSPAAN